MASNDKDYDKVFGALDGAADPVEIRDKKMTEAYRRLFSTSDGKLVLHQILVDLKFYDECISDADVALNNFAKFMIFKRLKVHNSKQITKVITEIQWEETNG